MTIFYISAILLGLVFLGSIAGRMREAVNGIAVIATVWLSYMEHADDPEALVARAHEIQAALGIERGES
jgi:hypothetical protein